MINRKNIAAAHSYFRIGEEYLTYKNNYKAALHYLYLALKIYVKIDLNKTAKINMLCGDIALKLNDTTNALQKYYIAQKQAITANNLEIITQACLRCTEVNLTLGNYNFAKTDLEKIIFIIKDHEPFWPIKAKMHLLLAKIYKKIGTEQQVYTQLGLANKVLAKIGKYKHAYKINITVGDYWLSKGKTDKAITQYYLASLYSKRIGKYKISGDYAQKCADLNIQNEELRQASRSYYAAAVLYARAHQYKKALRLYEKCYLLNMELNEIQHAIEIINKIAGIKLLIEDDKSTAV